MPFVKGAIYLALDYIYIMVVHVQNKKVPTNVETFCGPDGTRTRDLRRDRAAF